jgi:shikimate kinase
MVEMPNNKAIMQKFPLIVELVGLAGAGKTTLSRALSQRDEKIQVASDIGLRNKEHIPIVIGHVPFMLSLFLRQRRSSRQFTWDEMKAMVYLKAWPHILRTEAMQSGTALLLDHGPIFKLATLNAFGPPLLRSQAFEQWWHSMFERWAFTLDIIIWLKAPDEILIERINTRNQRHAVKGKSEVEAHKFLMRYQKSYEQILTKLSAYGRPTLLQFDSSQASVEQIVDQVLLTCNCKLGRS